MGDYINMLHDGLIHNCTIIPQAVTIANIMFGPDIATLGGKITRKSYDPVVTDYVEISQSILDQNKEVTLTVYLIFVNGIGLFVCMSCQIKFTTLKYLSSCTKGK